MRWGEEALKAYALHTLEERVQKRELEAYNREKNEKNK